MVFFQKVCVVFERGAIERQGLEMTKMGTLCPGMGGFFKL